MPKRSAFTVIELLAALVILATAVSLAAQALVMRAHHQRGLERRAAALEAASQLLEQATALPFAGITSQSVAALPIPAATAGQLPHVELHADVQSEGGGPATKLIWVQLRWKEQGTWREVELVTEVADLARRTP